jgi:hypothetical protein
MRPQLAIGLAIIATYVRPMAIGKSPTCQDEAPRINVETLWTMATRGELLTPEGWHRALGYFMEPDTEPKEKAIDVVSDYYGVNASQNDDKTAKVDMEYTDLGHIDAQLKYTRPPVQTAYKTSIEYQLVVTPVYVAIYGADGKTLIEKKVVPGEKAWVINGPPPRPWATVNATIRYVLLQRNKTTDPAIKKNADDTLAILLNLP